ISGDGVSRCYANNDIENSEKFITLKVNNIEKKIFRTGDIGLINPNNYIECYGRKDNQIKIRGHRINLEEIEQEILHSNLVESVVVDIIKPIEIQYESYIMAYIVPKKEFYPSDLKEKISKILPDYMMPRISLVPYIAINQNGKADKKKLYEMSKENQYIDTGNDTETITKLKDLWGKLLNYSLINTEDNFFELGGSSLQVATLVMDIEKYFDVKISIIELYNNPILKELAQLIELKQKNINSTLGDNIIEILRSDGNIELPEFEKEFSCVNWLSKSEGRIFLTGGTGFLGAFFLNDLCKEKNIQEIYCLV